MGSIGFLILYFAAGIFGYVRRSEALPFLLKQLQQCPRWQFRFGADAVEMNRKTLKDRVLHVPTKKEHYIERRNEPVTTTYSNVSLSPRKATTPTSASSRGFPVGLTPGRK